MNCHSCQPSKLPNILYNKKDKLYKKYTTKEIFTRNLAIANRSCQRHGGKFSHIFEIFQIPDPDLPLHYANFMALQ